MITAKLKKKETFICEYCSKTWETTKSGYSSHIRSCLQNPNRIAGNWAGRKHSEKTKLQISKTIQENGKHFTWGDLSRRGEHSYPEKWLIEVLKNELQLEENVDYKTEVHFHTFWLDFVFGDKYVIEVDGGQHISNSYQKDCDMRKDELLRLEGFKELRLPWDSCKDNPQETVKKVKDFWNLG